MGSIIEKHPKFLRDAFLKGEGFAHFQNSTIIQIEEIQEFFEKDSPYIDLVAFETDIALVCELVILFSESPGSFVELGCFSMVDELYEKILIIVQNQHLSKSTFISKGPVANFKRSNEKSVFTIVDSTIGIIDGQISTVDPLKLIEAIKTPIALRITQTEGRTTLDKSKFNHLCKIYVALLKEFFALNDEELLLLLWELGFEIDAEKLRRVAFCCKALRWTNTTTVGYDQVHFAIPGTNEAAKFEFRAGFSDKIRRRIELRSFWERTDPNRAAAVGQEFL